MDFCIWCRKRVFFIFSILLLLSSLTNALRMRFDIIEKHRRNIESSENCTDCSPDPCCLNPAFISPSSICEAHLENLHCSKVDVDCEFVAFNKYRTIDGSCNNLENPSWGMSNTCHRRILPHDYGDDISYPKQSCVGGDLPSSRVVSNEIHQEDESNLKYDSHTVMFMEWGQIIAHDCSLNDGIPGVDEEDCCKNNNLTNEVCISAEVPEDDPFFKGKRNCLPLIRSKPCHLCKDGKRQSLNEATSYMDLSLVYGSNRNVSNSLRSFEDGMLRVQNSPKGGILPPGVNKMSRCLTTNPAHQCFLAGDKRVNMQMLLATIHILLIRHHNNLCRRLKALNPFWEDEVLFQESRRICIAQAQMITFGPYLRNVLGDYLTERFKLAVEPGLGRTYYEPSLDASTLDEFSAAALRFGHSMIRNSYVEIDPATKHFDVIYIRDHFNYPDDFYTKPFTDRVAQGMGAIYGAKLDVFVGGDMRNFLHVKRNKKERGGSDLAAVSVARDRDHGIPGYTYYLKYFFDYDVTSFCDLNKFMPMSFIRKLQKVYRSVHDIGLYTAGLGEYHVSGGIVGPTFAAILISQFTSNKFGDRYYFEHENESGSFTPEQLSEIKKTTFASIICSVTDIEVIQRDVFRKQSKDNPVVKCTELHEIDLRKWKEFRKW